MKRFARQFTALVLACSLVASTPFTATGTDLSGFDPADVLAMPPPQAGELLAADLSRVISRQTRFIRYEATAYQRKVAEQRARSFVAAQRRAAAKPKTIAKTEKAPKKVAKSAPEKPQAEQKKIATKSEPVSRPQDVKIQETPQPKPLPRYIAVDTIKDERASPKAKKVVMIWDTQSESLVGNNLYDVENPPAVGTTTRFETYSAQYVGAGL